MLQCARHRVLDLRFRMRRDGSRASRGCEAGEDVRGHAAGEKVDVVLLLVCRVLVWGQDEDAGCRVAG